MSQAIRELLETRLDKSSIEFGSFFKRAKLELNFEARHLNELSLSSIVFGSLRLASWLVFRLASWLVEKAREQAR